MNAALTIELSGDLLDRLDHRAQREGRASQDIAAEILRRQLALDEFEEIRAGTVPRGRAAGFLTDDDVFRVVS